MNYTGNKDSLISCPNCNENFTIEDEIYNCYEKYENFKVVRTKTPCCQKPDELYLRNNIASRGYIYAAGQAHFAEMEKYKIDGLVVIYNDEQTIIKLNDTEIIIKNH
jgi:hypothetical protein